MNHITPNALDIAMLDAINQSLSTANLKVSSAIHNNVAIFKLRTIDPSKVSENGVCLSNIETNIQLTLMESSITSQYPNMIVSFTGYSVYLDDEKVI